MKQLLKFELKKILGRKANLIAMSLGLLLIVVSNILTIHGSSLLLEEGNTIEGAAAIRKQAEIENALTTELSEEFLTEFLQEYQQAIQNNPFGYDYSLISSKSNLFALIAAHYSEWNDNNWEWEDLKQISTENDIGFYKRRIEKIETLLNADYTYGNFTDTEKGYWLQKAEAISTPFVWGSRETWEMIWISIRALFFQCFVVGICIAPVFAEEYQKRTDSLILSTKHGKNRLIHAKIISSFVFTLFYIALCSILSIGINIVLLGIDGWNLPVQLWNTMIPYHFNAAGACGLNLLIIFLISFLITAITLMFSTVCKNQMIALAIAILLFFGPLFIPFSKTSGLWNHILYLCPIYTFNLTDVLKTYNSYQLGGIVISYFMMIVIAYVIIAAICLCCTERNFKKHQIGK